MGGGIALSKISGSATTSAVTPNHSVQFDGDGDYIESTTDSNVPVGTGDFTLEFWVRFASSDSTLDTVSETRSSTSSSVSDGFLVGRFHTSGHEDQMEIFVAGNYTGVASDALSNNTWYHIAAVRSSGTLRMYVNGQDTGTTYSDSNNYSNDDIRIGANIDTTYYLDGNVADFRLTTSALYTSNFAPPTDQLDPVTGTAILCCQDATGAGTATTGDNFTTVGNVTAVAVAPTTSGGGNQIYVDDVFSTYLPSTATSDQPLNIDNGIDLAGEGGLVWLKRRDGTSTQHALIDTERNADTALLLPSTGGNSVLTGAPYSSSFDSDGFTWGSENNFHPTGANYVSWTFRKAPGFFDVVTFQKTSGRTGVSHSLGSVPGMIIVKNIDNNQDWYVYHRSLTSNSYYLRLNDNAGEVSNSGVWNAETPTSTEFAVGSALTTDDNYVAYIFAHDDAQYGTDEDESIIKCGTWTASSGAASINLGFEPQFVLIKNATDAGAWFIFDNMRGMVAGGNDSYLRPDSDGIENSGSNFIEPTPTGFDVLNLGGSQDFIYMAIRRPHKPPVYGTEVFAMEDPGVPLNPDGLAFTSGFAVDMAFFKERSGTDSFINMSRVLGNQNWLKTQHTDAENNNITFGTWDHSTGWFSTGSANMSWMFKRAPGFFEISSYSGSGGAHDTAPKTVNHQLGVVPELIIIKNRTSVKNWKVWSSAIGAQKLGTLNTDTSWGFDFQIKNVTSTTFDVGLDGAFTHTNASGDIHIAYLFASIPGVSKIGTYTGVSVNGAALVTLGFTPRFIMVKSINASGEWIIYDSVRDLKIGSTSAKALSLSEGTTNNANETTIGSVDGLRATLTGFVINGAGASSDVNVYNEEFFYFAIA